MTRHAHPVFWLLDLAAALSDTPSATPRPAAVRQHPTRPRQRPTVERPRAAWLLSFEVLDRSHGPVIECHEVPAAGRARALSDWHRVLEALDAAGRLQWYRLDTRGEVTP